MSAVFLGISRFSIYLKLYYELYGAAEKLGRALDMPQEQTPPARYALPDNGALRLDQVRFAHNEQSLTLSMTLQPGQKCFVMTHQSWLQKQFISFLKRQEKPSGGTLFLGDQALQDYDVFEWRQNVMSLDRALIVECTIEDYLAMAAPSAGSGQIYDALKKVGLLEVIQHLPDGMRTTLSAMGSPLQPLQLLLLKLAATLLVQPNIVIINQHFDAIPNDIRLPLLGIIEQLGATVLYFTNAPHSDFFDGIIELEQLASQSKGAGHA